MPSVQAPKAYQTKSATISNTAKGIDHGDFDFSASEIADADYARVTAYTQPVVMTIDGTTPTSTLGEYMAAAGTSVVEGNQNVGKISLIRAGGSDATVSITLLKYS